MTATMATMSADVPRLLNAPRVRWVLIAASVLGLIIGLDTLVLHLRLDPLADVRAYYDAGARLNAGLPLYVQTATTDDPGFYRYPPLLAIAFRPLALLPACRPLPRERHLELASHAPWRVPARPVSGGGARLRLLRQQGAARPRAEHREVQAALGVFSDLVRE